MKQILVVLFLVLMCITQENKANVVHNVGNSGSDSLTMSFYILDSLGNITDIDAADSIGIITFYPEGTAAYSTIILGNNSNIISQTQTNIGTCYSYGAAVADIDGVSPSNGIYSWLLSVKDISLGLTTMHNGTFQLYTGADYNTRLDNLDALISGRSTFDPTTDSVNAKANILSISDDSKAADSLEALVDGESNFQLELKQLFISNPDGSAIYASSQASNGDGMYLESTQGGNGLYSRSTGTGNGIKAEAGTAGNGDGFTVLGNGSGKDINSSELTTLQDSVNVILDSLNSNGAGIYAYKITVIDSASNVPVPAVSAYMRNLDQTVLIATGRSNNDGELLFNLDVGSYFLIANASGYVFNAFDTIVVTGAGEDSLFGYTFDPGQPSQPNLCRAYAYIYDINGNPEPHATITASLPGGVARSGQLIVSPFKVSTVSDSLGYFYLDLIPSDSLSPSGQQYEITIAKKDGTIMRQRITIPPTTSWQISW